ncbi:MAG TPA: BON domain-containing protein [Thermoanaerobaculia bacterium]
MTKGTSSTLQHDVLAELEWDPSVDATKIGVTATDGVITLTGHVNTYPDKWAAERIAKRVHGVKAVANDVEVKLASGGMRDDTEIAKAVVDALSWNVAVPADKVKVTVTKGWVTLTGNLDWHYQKSAAEEGIRYLKGVRGVSNDIYVAPRVAAADVKQKIEAALKRSAEVDSKKVTVEASDSRVTLRGNVRSWAEHDDAVNAAWAAPGVRQVVDELRIHA